VINIIDSALRMISSLCGPNERNNGFDLSTTMQKQSDPDTQQNGGESRKKLRQMRVALTCAHQQHVSLSDSAGTDMHDRRIAIFSRRLMGDTVHEKKEKGEKVDFSTTRNRGTLVAVAVRRPDQKIR
jgi:hypothetical protein